MAVCCPSALRGVSGVCAEPLRVVGEGHDVAFAVAEAGPRKAANRRSALFTGLGLVVVVDADASVAEADDGACIALPAKGGVAERVAEAYTRWGEDFVDRLRGGFAVAIWDCSRRELVLARDALGERSVSYMRSGRAVAFATDVAGLLDTPAYPFVFGDGAKPQVETAAVARFLTGEWQADGTTYFRRIHDCPPGQIIHLSEGTTQRKRYWRIHDQPPLELADDRAYAEALNHHLDKAVSRRIRGSSQVALSLSGGLDSTLVGLSASRVTSAITTYSWVFDESSPMDERRWIEAVARHLQHPSRVIQADHLWTLRDLACWPIEPDLIWSDAQFLLSRAVARQAARDGCDLIVDGQFGDQLFAGPYRWPADLAYAGQWSTLLRLLSEHRRRLRWRDQVFTSLRESVSDAVSRMLPSQMVRARGHPHPGMTAALTSRWKAGRGPRGGEQEHDGAGPGWRARAAGVTASWWPQMFHEYRRVYARLGLRRASPLFDRQLIEFVMSLPAHQLGHPLGSRWVQRNAIKVAMTRGPATRVGKASFYTLFEEGLLRREARMVRRLLGDSLAVAYGWIEPGWLDSELAAGESWTGRGWPLWRVLCLELWLRRREGCLPWALE